MPKAKATTEITTATPVPLAMQSVHPGVMISAMVANHKEIDLAQMQGLFELQKQYDDELARKAYHAAKAQFSTTCPAIRNDGKVSFVTNTGGNTEYTFATLAGTLEAVRPALTECGLTASWKLAENADGDVTVTCFLTHELGYQEETSLTAPRASGAAAKMNAIQGLKSTISYLERITFFALLGLASKEDDDDAGSVVEDAVFIDSEDIKTIRSLMTATKTKVADFVKYLKEKQNIDIESLDQLPKSKMAIATGALNAKKNQEVKK
jgi:hypothetical protein